MNSNPNNPTDSIKDGVYTSLNATWWVKDGKIIMKLHSYQELFATTKDFMQGVWKHELPQGIADSFDKHYETLNRW